MNRRATILVSALALAGLLAATLAAKTWRPTSPDGPLQLLLEATPGDPARLSITAINRSGQVLIIPANITPVDGYSIPKATDKDGSELAWPRSVPVRYVPESGIVHLAPGASHTESFPARGRPGYSLSVVFLGARHPTLNMWNGRVESNTIKFP